MSNHRGWIVGSMLIGAAALTVGNVAAASGAFAGAPADHGKYHPYGCSAVVVPNGATLAATLSGCNSNRQGLQFYVNVNDATTKPQPNLATSAIVTFADAQTVTVTVPEKAFGSTCTLEEVQADLRVGFNLKPNQNNHNRSKFVHAAYVGPLTLKTGTCASSPSTSTSTSTSTSPTSSPTTSTSTSATSSSSSSTSTASVTTPAGPSSSPSQPAASPTTAVTPTGKVPQKVQTDEGQLVNQSQPSQTLVYGFGGMLVLGVAAGGAVYVLKRRNN